MSRQRENNNPLGVKTSEAIRFARQRVGELDYPLSHALEAHVFSSKFEKWSTGMGLSPPQQRAVLQQLLTAEALDQLEGSDFAHAATADAMRALRSELGPTYKALRKALGVEREALQTAKGLSVREAVRSVDLLFETAALVDQDYVGDDRHAELVKVWGSKLDLLEDCLPTAHFHMLTSAYDIATVLQKWDKANHNAAVNKTIWKEIKKRAKAIDEKLKLAHRPSKRTSIKPPAPKRGEKRLTAATLPSILFPRFEDEDRKEEIEQVEPPLKPPPGPADMIGESLQSIRQELQELKSDQNRDREHIQEQSLALATLRKRPRAEADHPPRAVWCARCRSLHPPQQSCAAPPARPPPFNNRPCPRCRTPRCAGPATCHLPCRCGQHGHTLRRCPNRAAWPSGAQINADRHATGSNTIPLGGSRDRPSDRTGGGKKWPQKPCWNFADTGSCRFGDQCSFSHSTSQ